jgi:hypothetical protein
MFQCTLLVRFFWCYHCFCSACLLFYHCVITVAVQHVCCSTIVLSLLLFSMFVVLPLCFNCCCSACLLFYHCFLTVSVRHVCCSTFVFYLLLFSMFVVLPLCFNCMLYFSLIVNCSKTLHRYCSL